AYPKSSQSLSPTDKTHYQILRIAHNPVSTDKHIYTIIVSVFFLTFMTFPALSKSSQSCFLLTNTFTKSS
ncbi:hypothetical protein L9F63_027518, partial [Diploptera punctata]